MKRVIATRNRQFTVDEVDSCIHQLFWDEVEAGHWEPYTFAALDECLRPGSMFLDVGAWLGAVSLYGAALGAECHALEPDPVAYPMLCRNVLANPGMKVLTIPAAAADHNGTLQMGSVDGLGSSMTSVMGKAEIFDAPCFTLSEIARDMNRVDMVKIDIEGAESLVLADSEFFKRFRPAVLITLHPHLAPCSLEAVYDIYETIEQVSPDVWLLRAA